MDKYRIMEIKSNERDPYQDELGEKLIAGKCIVKGCERDSASGINLCEECNNPNNLSKQQETTMTLMISIDDADGPEIEMIMPTKAGLAYERRMRKHTKHKFMEVKISYGDLDELITADAILKDTMYDEVEDYDSTDDTDEDIRLGSVIMTSVVPSIIMNAMIDLVCIIKDDDEIKH